MKILNSLLMAVLVFAGAANAQTAKPNIVVIMLDDARLDDLAVMTKTNRIFSTGTAFANFYVSLAGCCPSRATYLTGQYPHNHGVWANNPPNGGYQVFRKTNTLPLWLQRAGYYTGLIGKFMNGYPLASNQREIPPGWNNFQGWFTGVSMYGYRFNDNGVIRTGGTRPADYQTDVIANRALSMIDQAALRQPFFVSIMPQAVHEEGGLTTYPNPRPAPRHVGIFANRALPKPPSFNEADMSDKGASRPPMTATEIAIITKKYRSRLETILAVDDLVQRVVDTLAAKGLMQNTVVMLTSDNGYYYGEHRKPDGKGGFYPEATHMPLYILGPMFPDTIAQQFVSNVDLASTITDLANAVPGLPQDGRSLLPLALNPAASMNRSVLIEQLGFKSVINDAYLYAEKDGGARELYDLREGEATYDPYQIQSRHRDPAYSAVQTQLSQKVRSLSLCDGAACLQ